MVFEYGQYKIDVDVEKTKMFYAAAPVVSAGCTCNNCKNYEQAVADLPQVVKSFFTELGVDMKKVCEVYVNWKNPDGTLHYGGFYHVCGVRLQGKSAWVAVDEYTSRWDEGGAFAIIDTFHVSFREKCDLLEDEFPIPALQIDMFANIPWVLPEANEEFG